MVSFESSEPSQTLARQHHWEDSRTGGEPGSPSESLIRPSGVDLNVCISDEFPGAAAAGPETPL